MTSWVEMTVEEVCARVTSGGTPSRKVPEYFGGSIPWLKTKELSDSWVFTTEEKITERAVIDSSAKLLPINTVMMAMYGATVGKLAILGQQMTCNQAACAMLVDPEIADFRFLYYLLLEDRPRIVSLANGAAQQNLSAAVIKSLKFHFPPLPEQHEIAAALAVLDDKIESNRRVVTFIPDLIRAKVRSMLSYEAESVSVSSLAKFVNGGAYTKGATGKGRMVVRIADLNSGPGPSTVYNELDVPDEKTAQAGDILMSWSGSLGVYRWFREEAIVNQHIFKVLPDSYPDWLVFERLEHVLEVFQSIAKDKATTMGHIQRGHLETTHVEVPSPAAVAALDLELSPLWKRLLVAERENLKLARLRDALLPELLSGRIRVPVEVAS